MILHNLTKFHQNLLIRFPVIVFTHKVTHRQTKVITIPHHEICEEVKIKRLLCNHESHFRVAGVNFTSLLSPFSNLFREPSFWRSVLKTWLKNRNCNDYYSYPLIWNNKIIYHSSNELHYESWVSKGIIYLKNIFYPDKSILLYQEIFDKIHLLGYLKIE